MSIVELYWNGKPIEKSYCVFRDTDQLEIRYSLPPDSTLNVSRVRFGRKHDLALVPQSLNLVQRHVTISLDDAPSWSFGLEIELVSRDEPGASVPRLWLLSRRSVGVALLIVAIGAVVVAWRLAQFHRYMHPGLFAGAYETFLAILAIVHALPVARMFLPSERELPALGIVYLWERALAASLFAAAAVIVVPSWLFTAVQNETPHAVIFKVNDDEVKLGPGQMTILPTRDARYASKYVRLRPAETTKKSGKPDARSSYAKVYNSEEAHQNYCLHGLTSEIASKSPTSDSASATVSDLDEAGGCESHPVGEYDPGPSWSFIPRVAMRCRGRQWPLSDLDVKARSGVVQHAGLWLPVDPDDCSVDTTQPEVEIRLSRPGQGSPTSANARLGSLLAENASTGSLLVRYPWSASSIPSATAAPAAPDGSMPPAAPDTRTGALPGPGNVPMVRFEMPLDDARGTKLLAFSSSADSLDLRGEPSRSLTLSIGDDRGELPLGPVGNLACARSFAAPFSLLRFGATEEVERLRVTSSCSGSSSEWRRLPGSSAAYAWACDLRADCQMADAGSGLPRTFSSTQLAAVATVRGEQEPPEAIIFLSDTLPIRRLDMRIDIDGRQYTYGRLQCSDWPGKLQIRPVRVLEQNALVEEIERFDVLFDAGQAGAKPAGSKWIRDPTWNTLRSRVPGWVSPWMCEPQQVQSKSIEWLEVSGSNFASRADFSGTDIRIRPVGPRACHVYDGFEASVPSECATPEHCCLAKHSNIKGCQQLWLCNCKGKVPTCD
jgi:hypothetical protein